MALHEKLEYETKLQPGEYLQDYINELYNFIIDRDGKLHKIGEMKTVDDHFEGMTGAFAEGTRKDIAENPEKVAAINALAKKFNANEDPAEYKRLEAELLALLRG